MQITGLKDSNGDGSAILADHRAVGYLKDWAWMPSGFPVYDSPMTITGDIRDNKIMAEFGRMEDFDRLLAAVHARG